MSNKYVYTLLVKNKEMLAGTEGGGVVKYNTRQKIWKSSNRGLTDKVIFSLAENSSVLVASTWRKGIFRSMDGGNTWERSDEGLNNSVVYTVYSFENSFYAGASKNGVFQSNDNSVTWEHIGLLGLSVLTIFSVDNSLWVGTWKNGIYKFTEEDTTWENIAKITSEPVKSLVLKKNDNSVYCAKRMMGVYKSIDYGVTWQYVGLAGYNVSSLAALEDRIIGGTWGNGLFTLTDGDTAWISTARSLDGIPIVSLGEDEEKRSLQSRKEAKKDIIYEPLPKRHDAEIERLSESHIVTIRACPLGRLVLCYKVKNDGTVLIRLHDYRGKLKKKIVSVVTGGEASTSSFCTEELTNGVYFITLETLIDREIVALVLLK